MNKGISPFIAAVILISFVIAVGTIVSPWFTSFTRTKAYDVEENSEGQIDCIFSSISFSSSDIDYNLTGTDSVNITLDNTGSASLYNFEISLTVDGVVDIFSPTSNTQKTQSNPLESGEAAILVTNLTGTDLSGNLEKVRVVAKNCPNEAKKEVEL